MSDEASFPDPPSLFTWAYTPPLFPLNSWKLLPFPFVALMYLPANHYQGSCTPPRVPSPSIYAVFFLFLAFFPGAVEFPSCFGNPVVFCTLICHLPLSCALTTKSCFFIPPAPLLFHFHEDPPGSPNWYALECFRSYQTTLEGFHLPTHPHLPWGGCLLAFLPTRCLFSDTRS